MISRSSPPIVGNDVDRDLDEVLDQRGVRARPSWYTPAMREIEERVGVPHLDQLLAERARLVDRVKELRPHYGPAALWKEKRDNLKALVAIDKRAELAEWAKANPVKDSKGVEKPASVTEAMVEERVRTDQRWTDFMAKVEREQIEYGVLADQISDIDTVIEWAKSMAYYAGREVALQ